MLSRPLRTRTEHELPFERLSPRDFERLCLDLIQREGYEEIQHLGAAGGEQGRDIVAVRAGRRIAFQCKRVREFAPADAEREVDKILALPRKDRPAEYIFLVTSDVTAQTRERAQERAGTIVCRFWALTELDLRVRKHPDLIRQFFGLLGEPTPIADEEWKVIRRLLDDKTAKLPPNAPPSKILTADYEVIPFDELGRREELELLASFCGNERRQSVLLLTGEGGTGKTRLLVEWCQRLRKNGWHAGFLRSDRKESDLDSLLGGVAPRLIVVDYAETRLQMVEALLLKTGLVPEEGPKVRLVLLARQVKLWDALQRQKERPIEDLFLGSPSPRNLTPLLADPEDRLLSFRSAVRVFADQLGREIPENLAIPDLSDHDFERVLYLHMAALAALEGDSLESAHDALERTLDRERRYWRYYISQLDLDGHRRKQLGEALEKAVAVITFLGGACKKQQGRKIISHVLAPIDFSSGLDSDLFDILESLCGTLAGGGEIFLKPLQPDLLGEQLVVERWAQDAVLWQDLGFKKTSDEFNGNNAAHFLTVLTRLASRRPDTAEQFLSSILKGRGEDLFPVVLNVAVETGDPIGRIFAEILEEENFILLARIMILCGHERYHRSVPLREVGLVTTSRALEILRTRWKDPTADQRAELTRLSISRGQCLYDLGRNEEALQVTRKAVDSYRHFAQRNPDTFLPHLAAGLNNLGTLLSELGQREEALLSTSEALQIYRQLARDFQEYHARLAACLDNQANRLSELGRYQGALQTSREALVIHRELVAGSVVFSPDLANSLNNLGAHLKALGLNEEAVEATQEAVHIRNELVTYRPDAFLPDLASSLNNLGALLASLGRQEESLPVIEEAVGLWRSLAKTKPDAFLSDLAGGLENLGTVLSDLGQPDAALGAIREAVGIYRRFAPSMPDVFAPKLAQALSSLSNVLSDIGQSREALDLVRESEVIFRNLAQKRPKVFVSHLAGSLVNLGNRLAEAGCLEEALQASREAIDFYRQLIQTRPEVFLPDLAKAIMNLGNRLREGGQAGEALATTREAVDIYRKLAAQRADVFLPELARSLNNQGLQFGDDGKKTESLLCFKEAIEILIPFSSRRPAAFSSWIKTMVRNYRECLEELGRTPDEELLRPLRESLQDEV